MFLFIGVASAFYIYNRATGRFLGESEDFVPGRSYRDVVLATSDLATDWQVKDTGSNGTAYNRAIASKESMKNGRTPNVFDISQTNDPGERNIRIISYPMNSGGSPNQDIKIVLSASGQFYLIGENKCLSWNGGNGRIEAMHCSAARFADFDIYVDIAEYDNFPENIIAFSNMFDLMLMDEERLKKAMDLEKRKGSRRGRSTKDLLSSSTDSEDTNEVTSIKPIRDPHMREKQKDSVGFIKKRKRSNGKKRTDIFVKDSGDVDSVDSDDILSRETAKDDIVSSSDDIIPPERGALGGNPYMK